MSHINSEKTKTSSNAVMAALQALIEEVLPNVPEKDILQKPFLEMGANSLVLMELQKTVEEKWQLQLKLPMFFEELTNLEALIDYIERHGKPAISNDEVRQDSTLPTLSSVGALSSSPSLANLSVRQGEIESLLTAQIEGATQALNGLIERQLAFLSSLSPEGLRSTQKDHEPLSAKASRQASRLRDVQEGTPLAGTDAPSASAPRPQLMLKPLEIRARGLTETQREHLESLIARYTDRTKKSKAAADEARPALADSRASVGFRFTTKEMLYPIVGARSQGSKLWDIDGNEYVDITMGQGVTLFGHHPKFIDDVLRDRPSDSMELGPRPPEAAEAAKLLAELTGMERFTFTNSGTEAVMAAIRLARAATGREKIVMFQGSYHGHADNVMGLADHSGSESHSKPASSGIPQGAVQDLIILEYGDERALETIKYYGPQIAAVLVEPVQSRRPSLQPIEFVRSLRELTQSTGSLLIFDEMITGFRIHQQGAQAWFGVKADIATYGKVVGGGMPIGVVAGRNGLMDPIDGGTWQFGDNSYPSVERVIFGGTFCQHPLVMATTLATLRHLKSEGPGLQDSLNKKTEALKTRLNAFFEEEAMPISIVNFGSLFRFDFKENLELLFYHLMEKGVFIWEWRNYFLSTAHSDSDIDFVAEKIMESAIALRKGGFLSSLDAGRGTQSISTPGKGSAVSLPMSKAQEQLFTLHQMTREGSKAYLVGGTVELSGDLSRERLEKAFAEAVAAQESLFLVPSSPTGELRPNAASPTLEWGGEFSGSEGLTLEQEWLNRPMNIDFDLEKGPLLKGHLRRGVNGSLLLRLIGHHFAIDGISMNLLFREIINRYDGVELTRENEKIGVKKLRNFLDSQDYRAEKEYWTSLLSNRPNNLELPRDQRGKTDWNFDAVRYAFAFGEEETQKLRERAVKSGCTEFMYFFSAFAAWLRQLTGAEDFLIGVPVTGRPNKEFDDVIGYLTHLIPVRIDSRACDSEGAFIASARRSLLEAYEHQNLAFSEIMALAPRVSSGSGLAAENLISVIFNFDEPGNLQGPGGTPAQWHPTPAGFTAFDLICNVTVGAKGYFLELTQRADYVSDDLSKELGEGLVKSVRNGLTAPDGISLFAGICSEDSIRRQKEEFECGPSVDIEPSIIAGIREVFISAASDVAVEFEEQQVTFADLDHRSNRVAQHLHSIGLSRGDRVIVTGQHSPELLASMVGVLRAGCVMVPVDPATPALRKQWICKDSGARALLCENPGSEWEGIKAEPVLISEIAASGEAEDGEFWVEISKDDVAYVLYTSGSTGRPKGVEISHGALANYVVWAAEHYELSTGSGAVFHGSIGFDATLTSIFPPLFSGQRIVIPEQSADPILGIANLIRESRNLSLLKLTPTHLELLNASLGNRIPQDSVRYIVLGGEAVKMGAVLPWLGTDSYARVINEYGPTETVVGCCVYEIPKNATLADPVPIGRPIQNVGLRVLDTNRNPVPLGVTGELFIYGQGVGNGYLNQDSLTGERFITLKDHERDDQAPPVQIRGYLTGDLARWEASGNLMYLGRKDDQIKLRGFRIEPEEVESLITQHPAVAQSAVMLHEASENDHRLVALVVPVKNMEVDTSQLLSLLREQLPSAMIPSAIKICESLPLSINGKVDRKAIAGLFSVDQRPARVPREADALEQKVSEIWKKILKLDDIPIDTNFFDLGGHSILVLKLIEAMNDQLQASLKPLDVYEASTVRLIAERMRRSDDVITTLPAPGKNRRRGVDSRAQRNRDFVAGHSGS